MASFEKESVVKHLTEIFSNPEFLIFTGYRGLKVDELTELRKILAKEHSDFQVVKNTLAKLGAKKAKREELLPFLEGPVAIITRSDENMHLIKLLVNFAKAHPFLTIKGGIIQERVLSDKKIDSLAKLPSREILLSQLRSGFLAPLSGLVFSLKGLLQGLVGVLRNIEKQKA